MDTEFECQPGEVIIEQGERGRGFYVLKTGAVEVYKDGLLLNILKFPGTVFGEMADILGRDRSCSIRAKTVCRLIHVDESDVAKLIQERPEIAIKIMKTLATRLDKTTQKLAELFQSDEESPVWSVNPE